MSLEGGSAQSENVEKEFKYDALVVLGAAMEWSDDKKRWEFPTIVDNYDGKFVMGKARALAARELQNEAPLTLVTGGSDEHPETGERVSRAEELTKLMTERYKMTEGNIVPIGTEGASNTAGNVENVVAYLKQNPEILKRHRIAILMPRFQHKRAQFMFDANPYFKEQRITIDWIKVEDVLEKRSPLYKQWADAVDKTPEAEINREKEAEGLRKLKDDTYDEK